MGDGSCALWYTCNTAASEGAPATALALCCKHSFNTAAWKSGTCMANMRRETSMPPRLISAGLLHRGTNLFGGPPANGAFVVGRYA